MSRVSFVYIESAAAHTYHYDDLGQLKYPVDFSHDTKNEPMAPFDPAILEWIDCQNVEILNIWYHDRMNERARCEGQYPATWNKLENARAWVIRMLHDPHNYHICLQLMGIHNALYFFHQTCYYTPDTITQFYKKEAHAVDKYMAAHKYVRTDDFHLPPFLTPRVPDPPDDFTARYERANNSAGRFADVQEDILRQIWL